METAPEKSKNTYIKRIILLTVLAAIVAYIFYNNVIIQTVDSGDGWKHQIGHFEQCMYDEYEGCGEATHRIHAISVNQYYCEEHWQTNGIDMFERLADKNISSGKSNSKEATNAKVCAVKAVEDKLKSPSTADFCSYTSMTATDLGNNKWKVSGYVDAQNSFGAVVREYWTVTLTLTSSGFKDSSVTFSEE